MYEEPLPSPAETFEIGKDGPSAIVVGFDGTAPSSDALAYAAGLARRERAHLLAVFVSPLQGGLTGLAATNAGLHVDDEPLVRSLREEVEDCAEASGVGWTLVQRCGDAVQELEGMAEEHRADAIVVGRSASKKSQVLGSVTLRLIKHAKRPVIVVP